MRCTLAGEWPASDPDPNPWTLTPFKTPDLTPTPTYCTTKPATNPIIPPTPPTNPTTNPKTNPNTHPYPPLPNTPTLLYTNTRRVGNLAMPRPLEVSAALNRLRSLQIAESKRRDFEKL